MKKYQNAENAGQEETCDLNRARFNSFDFFFINPHHLADYTVYIIFQVNTLLPEFKLHISVIIFCLLYNRCLSF
jgi:hypothetical protein